MSKAKRRVQQQARAAFVATINDTAGQFFLGFPDGCVGGYDRTNRLFYMRRTAEHDPTEHDWAPKPRPEFGVTR